MAFRNGVATESEIENAMRLAQNLMARHAIDAAEIADASGNFGGVDRCCAVSSLGSRRSTWEVLLAAAVLVTVPAVSSCSARVQFLDGGVVRRVVRVVWYGPAEDVGVSKELFDSTRALVLAMARRKWGGAFRGQGRSYCEGFASGLYRLACDRRDASELAASLTALALRHEEENARWLAGEHGIEPRDRKVKTNGEVHLDAFFDGRRDSRGCRFSTDPVPLLGVV